MERALSRATSGVPGLPKEMPSTSKVESQQMMIAG